jgi:hypothetical protein
MEMYLDNNVTVLLYRDRGEYVVDVRDGDGDTTESRSFNDKRAALSWAESNRQVPAGDCVRLV